MEVLVYAIDLEPTPNKLASMPEDGTARQTLRLGGLRSLVESWPSESSSLSHPLNPKP